MLKCVGSVWTQRYVMMNSCGLIYVNEIHNNVPYTNAAAATSIAVWFSSCLVFLYAQNLNSDCGLPLSLLLLPGHVYGVRLYCKEIVYYCSQFQMKVVVAFVPVCGEIFKRAFHSKCLQLRRRRRRTHFSRRHPFTFYFWTCELASCIYVSSQITNTLH